MKILFKNLLSIVRRFKTVTILNILGMAAAFCCALTLLIQWNYDRTYNCSLPNSDRLYEVVFTTPTGVGTFGISNVDGSEWISVAWGEEMKDLSAHIQSVAVSAINNEPVTYNVGEKLENFKTELRYIRPRCLQVFGFDIIAGDSTDHNNNGIILPESMALRYWGRTDIVGERLKTDGSQQVAMVYRDFPENSSMQNIAYSLITDNNASHMDETQFNTSAYLLLDNAANKDIVEKAIQKRCKDIDESFNSKDTYAKLVSVNDVHFMKLEGNDNTVTHATQNLRMAIAILLILIAAVNFTNFNMGLVPMRIKSINTQKVLGATSGKLRRMFVVESVMGCLIALIIALFVLLSWGGLFGSLIEIKVNLLENILLLTIFSIFVIAMGIVVALYPAHYILSFSPAIVLKGSFGLSANGRMLRNVLVSFQFVIAFILIIAAITMYCQRGLLHTNLGYDNERILIADVDNSLKGRQDALIGELRKQSVVANAAYCFQVISSDNSSEMCTIYGENDEQVMISHTYVGDNFMNTMNIPLVSGHDFTSNDHNAWIMSASLAKQYPVFLERSGQEGKLNVIGVYKDIIFRSLHEFSGLHAFHFVNDVDSAKSTQRRLNQHIVMRIKQGIDISGARQQLNEFFNSFAPEQSFDLRFYDSCIERAYDKDIKLMAQVTTFSIMAVLLSIIGVFGLVMLESEYRRKEIGIRKVLGSSTTEILIMFNRRYLRIIGVCFIVSAPIAYWLMTQWLASFNQKTPIYWWIFLVSLLSVVVITVFTVTYQSWKNANENPVNSIKTE